MLPAHLLRLVDQSGDQPLSALGHLGTRATRIVGQLGFTTVRALVEWLGEDAARARGELGRVTWEGLLAHLDDAAERGLTRLVFGRDEAPRTATDLLHAWLERHELAREREMAAARYLRGQTLQEIGDAQAPQVTRERVRQVVTGNLRTSRPAWAPAATRVLAPVEALLESSGGLAPLEGCLALCGADASDHLLFCTELASEEPRLALITTGGASVVTSLGTKGAWQLCGELWRELDAALSRRSKRTIAREVLAEFGVRLPEPLETALLRDFLRVELDGDEAWSSRRWTQSVWEQELRILGRPASVHEVVAEVAKKHPGLPASPRNAATHFLRSKEVFSCGRDAWVHADHLAVDVDTLERIATACLAEVPRREQASSVRHALARVAKVMPVPEALSPYTVRDAMVHTGQVRSWRNSLDVGWKDLDSTRLTIEDRIRRSALALDQPFHISELVSEVATLGGTNEDSVLNKIAQAIDLLALGGGEYLVREKVFPTEGELADEIARVASLVPQGRVVSVKQLAALARPRARALALYADDRMAWALAERSPQLVCRLRGGLVWRREAGEHLWDVLRAHLPLAPEFKAAQFGQWLAETLDVESDAVATTFLQEGVDAGVLLRLGGGRYRLATGAVVICPSEP